VLLKRTGQEPKTLPTQMTTNVWLRLRRCVHAEGSGISDKMQSTFPNGIVTLPSSPRKG
jgi:hypothetical protein